MKKRRSARIVRTMGSLVLALLAGIAITVGASLAQDESTPEALGSLTVIDSQDADLDGSDVIWQIDTVVANPEDGDNPEFEARRGFIYADTIPVTITVDGGEPIELAVGESLAIKPRQKITAFSTDGTIGSFKTLELIESEATDVTVTRQVIGADFTPDEGDYVLELSRGELEPGVAVPLPSVELPAMVLVIEGTLVHARSDDEPTDLTIGEAGAGTGGGSAVAGPDGAVFLITSVVTEAEAAATPSA